MDIANVDPGILVCEAGHSSMSRSTDGYNNCGSEHASMTRSTDE